MTLKTEAIQLLEHFDIMYNSYKELLSAVKNNGSLILPSSVSVNRSFEAKELNNVQLMITDDIEFILNEDERKYLNIEMDWYMDRIPKLEKPSLELKHEKENKLIDTKGSGNITTDNINRKLKEYALTLLDGCVNRAGPNSNYGEMCLRLKNHLGITQLEWVCTKLEKDKASRQAVAFYNSPNYQYWSNNDFVCTLNQMFTIKDNRLDTVVNIRSNDLVNCFRFDSIWYRTFQKIVLDRLSKTYPDLKLGYLLCNIFSAHYYIKDEQKLDLLLSRHDDEFLNLRYEIFL